MALTEQQVINFLKQHEEPIGIFALRDALNISKEDFPEVLNKILRDNPNICSGMYHYGNCSNGVATDDGPHGYERKYMWRD